ncbi:MAG: TldD/PmbA family protein [Deltaproteobacteria bacterium]|nr:TldD/PmbA family protein [Deltaproteobacteria bacterium]
MTQSAAVPFETLDTPAIARALSQLAEKPGDWADLFLERTEEIRSPAEGKPPGVQTRREEGLAVRLVRAGESWLAARDAITPKLFSEALRQVARALPAAAYPEPRMALGPWPGSPDAPELAAFSPEVHRALREKHVAFPAKISVTRHSRWLQVIGTRWSSGTEYEHFYSCTVEMPWGRFGTLLPSLEEAEVETVASHLLDYFRARQALPPEPVTGLAVLGPAAAAVLLHEAVAHALEADTLALGGSPAAALGVRLGAPGLHVLDDPSSAPAGIKRVTDDEGLAVCRRWLLRDGIVEQPLADMVWSQSSPELLPGAARRSNRHWPPAPRSSHLEVLGGPLDQEQLLAGGDGLFLSQAERGRLDSLSGEFHLFFPFGRRIRSGELAETVGPCRLEGRVGNLLEMIRGIGQQPQVAGAGWCAKGGQKLPVWATTPSLRLEEARLLPC